MYKSKYNERLGRDTHVGMNATKDQMIHLKMSPVPTYIHYIITISSSPVVKFGYQD